MLDDTMTDWAIVVTNGVRLVGRLTGQRLSPVYELQLVHAIMQPNPRAPPNIVQVAQQAGDPLGYELDHIDVPAGALIVPLSDMTQSERSALVNGLDGFEKLKAQQRSNLVVAPAHAVDALNGQAAKLVRRG